MALTQTQEQQVLQLVDQLPALLELAERNALIQSKLGAQKRNLSQLPAVVTPAPEDIVFVRQGVEDKTMTIAAITQVASGGSLIATNNLSDVPNKQTGFNNIKQPATELASGVVEFADDLETTTGTAGNLATHPKGVLAAITSFFTGKKATQAQADAGTDDVNYITAAKMRFGFDVLAGTGLAGTTGTAAAGWKGHIKFPKFLGAFQICFGFNRVVVQSALGSTAGTGVQAFSSPFTHVFTMFANNMVQGGDSTEAAEVKVYLNTVTNIDYNITLYRQDGSNPSVAEGTGIVWCAIGRWA